MALVAHRVQVNTVLHKDVFHAFECVVDASRRVHEVGKGMGFCELFLCGFHSSAKFFRAYTSARADSFSENLGRSGEKYRDRIGVELEEVARTLVIDRTDRERCSCACFLDHRFRCSVVSSVHFFVFSITTLLYAFFEKCNRNEVVISSRFFIFSGRASCIGEDVTCSGAQAEQMFLHGCFPRAGRSDENDPFATFFPCRRCFHASSPLLVNTELLPAYTRLFKTTQLVWL